MNKSNKLTHLAVVYHPGETLDEKLKEMGMSIKEFAVRTGKPEKTIIAVIKGTSPITSEMAVSFENVTAIPAHFWMNAQRMYDEYIARLKREKDAALSAEYPKPPLTVQPIG
jgi:addiction module HigA family antidote